MVLIPLGTSGWIPTEHRSTSSFIIEADNKLILIDAGTGISKLDKYSDYLDKYDEVDIILSHYHLDHIIGLTYLPRWMKQKNMTIWGPGKEYYGKSCEEILIDFTSVPFFANNIKKFAREVQLNDYNESGFNIGDVQIAINKQVHSNPSFGITIGEYLHYATDTNIIEENFTKKCKLILHECWSKEKKDAYEHSSLEEIRQMVKKHHIKKIGLIHVNPRYSEDKLKFYEDDRIFIVEEEKKIIL